MLVGLFQEKKKLEKEKSFFFCCPNKKNFPKRKGGNLRTTSSAVLHKSFSKKISPNFFFCKCAPPLIFGVSVANNYVSKMAGARTFLVKCRPARATWLKKHPAKPLPDGDIFFMQVRIRILSPSLSSLTPDKDIRLKSWQNGPAAGAVVKVCISSA